MKYYWISDTKYVASGVKIVYIILFYVHDNALASHRSPMTIYIKSRGSGIQPSFVQDCIYIIHVRIYETNEILLDQ